LSVERSELNVERSAPRGAVFLSYAREDADAARRIAEALRAFGVEVWFDQNELRGGDTWDQKIRTQIKTCALFVPLVSQRTEERAEGYFRREWKLAIDRTQDMAGSKAFIVPVVIDATRESGASVPEEFMRYQWTRLADAQPTPEFVMQVKRLLETPKKSPVVGRGLPTPPGSPSAASQTSAGSGDPALHASRASRQPVLLGVIAVAAIAAAVYFALRPSAKEPAAPTTPPKPVAEAKPAPAPTVAVPAISEKSLAVLPFANMSEEKDSGFFSDGIHEDILTNLALIRELHVVSRTSVMQYRGTTKTIRQIAQELGVAYILEGSVRRAGNRVRVTGQLVRAATDEHVWAKNYDRDLTDVFSIQSALATEIADALSAALSPQEKQLLDRRPTENLAAYDLYAKARELRQRGTGTSLEVVPFLEDAVRLDPKFAQAWAELGSTHAQTYFNEIDHSAERLDRAKAAIDTAVRLAPDDPLVIEKLGDYYYYGYRDFTRASEQYQRLAVLRPNDAAVFGSLGFIHRRQGRWAEALAELRRAVALEPRNLRYGRTLQQLATGLCLYDEAMAVQNRIVGLFPESLLDGSVATGLPFLARGSVREGKEWLAQLKPAGKDEPLAISLRQIWARVVGDWDEALRLERRQRYYDGFEEPHWSQDVSSAFVHWASGDQVAARALAESAIPAGKAELERKPSATTWTVLSNAYALTGNKAESLRCAQAAKDLIPESKDAVAGPPLSLNYAQMLAWTGDRDGALAELARLLRTPFGENIYTAKAGYGWLPLRGDPRFEALVNDPKNNAPLVP
jgi:TolB-like protein